MNTKHLIIAVLLTLTTTISQAQVHQEGNITLNGGVGFGSIIYGGVSLNVFGEYAINDQIAVGFALGHASYSEDFGIRGLGSLYKYNVTYLGPRVSYHFAEAVGLDEDQFDLYGGIFVGYGIYSVRVGNERVRNFSGLGLGLNSFAYTVFAGARYQFTERVAAYGELGAGTNILQLGVSFGL